MRRDTPLRCPKNSALALIALPRGAAAARYPLVAGLGDVLEVDATCALQQVPAGRGEVAQLARGAREQRLREPRIARANGAVGSALAVAHQAAAAPAPAGARVAAVIC